MVINLRYILTPLVFLCMKKNIFQINGKSTTFAFASVDDISTNRHHYMSLCVFSFIYL